MSYANAIRAGLAYVELYADDKRLKQGLAGVAKSLKSWSVGIAGIGAATAGMGLAVEGGLGMAVRSFVATGDELEKMSLRTGMSVEQLSLLSYAAGQSDASLQDVAVAARHMATFMLEANSGSAEATRILETLGMRFEDIRKIHPDVLFQKFGKAIADLPLNTMERNAAAVKVFGRGGLSLIPMLKELDSLLDEGQKLGLVVSAEDAHNAVELGDAWDRLVKTFKAGVFAIGASLGPDLKNALDITLGISTGVLKWVQENRELAKTIALIAGGLTAIGGLAVGLGVSIAVISAGISSGILPGIALAAAFWGAIAGSVYLIYRNSTQLQNLWSDLVSGFGPAWEGIIKAVKHGELQLAFDILMTQVQLTWVQKLGFLERRWARASATIANVWSDLTTSLRDAWDIVVFAMSNVFGGFMSYLGKEFMKLQAMVIGLLKLASLVGGEEFKKLAAAAEALAQTPEAAAAGTRAILEKAAAVDPALKKTIDERHAQADADKAAREKGVRGLTYDQMIREDKLQVQLGDLLERANALKPSERVKTAPGQEDFTDQSKLGALGTFSGTAAAGMFGGVTDQILNENQKQTSLLKDVVKAIEGRPVLTFGF